MLLSAPILRAPTPCWPLREARGSRARGVITGSIMSPRTRSTAHCPQVILRLPRPPGTSPTRPYSASKAGSDHLVRAYHHTFGLQVTTSNCSNNYGPYHFPEKLIPLCLTRILDGGQIPVYGDGSNIRDWLYVTDHARGIANILESGKAGEVYNIGGHNEWANLDIVRLLCRVMDERFAADEALAMRFPNAPQSRGANSDA